ncbi:acyltransferase [Lacrimispora sp. 210928-DFI.3.58]|nr:acyltransferase [Lacrimispora sp. 210928-DFI.3.58]
MIILYHDALHGYSLLQTTGFHEIYLDVIALGGKLGVNLFVLIIGWYCIDNTPGYIKCIKKVLAFDRRILFCTITCFVFFGILGADLTWERLLKSIFPLLFNTYWFMTAIAVLYLLIPTLNKLIYSLNKKEFTAFIILMFVLWSIIPSITFQQYSGMNWNQQLQVIMMYFLGTYLKKYGCKHDKKLAWGKIAFLIGGFHIFAVIILGLLGHHRIPGYLRSGNYPTTLLCSVCIFMSFVQRERTVIPAVNGIAGYMLDVYLWHENIFVESWLWLFFYKLPVILPVHSLIALVCIMAIGISAGMVRGLFENIIIRKIYYIEDCFISRMMIMGDIILRKI